MADSHSDPRSFQHPSKSPRTRQERMHQPVRWEPENPPDLSRASRRRQLREQKMERRFVSGFILLFTLTVAYLMARSPLGHFLP